MLSLRMCEYALNAFVEIDQLEEAAGREFTVSIRILFGPLELHGACCYTVPG
jgi:hypothetical protein